jgi:iron complex transport system ATP-binding protein
LKTLGHQKSIPSLIYVTHHIEEILPFFGKTLVLRDGGVLYSGTTSAVLKGNVLKELYGVSLKIIRKKGRYWPVIR